MGLEAAELAFAGIDVVTSGAKLAWLYNFIAAIVRSPIQDAITREVASQVMPNHST